MKLSNTVKCLLLAIGFIQANHPSPEPTVFVASTPCDRIPRTMLSIPAESDCEFITWNLALHRDPRNQNPTRYNLQYTYGMSKLGTRGFMNGGTTATKQGTWSLVNAPQNRRIYRLNPDTPNTALSFLLLNDNLLHLLDSQEKLMIGHAGWSYTMNRK